MGPAGRSAGYWYVPIIKFTEFTEATKVHSKFKRNLVNFQLILTSIKHKIPTMIYTDRCYLVIDGNRHDT